MKGERVAHSRSLGRDAAHHSEIRARVTRATCQSYHPEMRRFLLILWICALAVTGCTSGSAGDDDDGSSPTPSPLPTGWQTLVSGSWTLPPGGEDTADTHTVTLDRDIYVGAIRPIAPPGTHHTVLYKGASAIGNMIYASGTGPAEITFPDGVGLKLLSGTVVRLELHIFNASSDPLSGTSGIEIVEVPAAEVVEEADIYLPGPLAFSIPPSATNHIETDICTLNASQTVFALFPHMHQMGTYFKTTLVVNGTPTVLHDAPYYFESQTFTGFTPIALSTGDEVRTECTWTNPTTSTIGWGESSNQEMCFSILYRYPARGDGFCL